MARPIWTGTLSFGLLNVPIQLMAGERRTDLSFRMLDSRNNKPVRYERVNSDTGEEVPWKDIVKAYEYDKNSYVVLDENDIKAAAPESHETVEIEAFVDADSIQPSFYEKPYVLVPGKKAEKGYVLLRDTLVKTGKVGIARVVIRTREYLAAVMPQGHALIMILLRYPQELVDVEDFNIPVKGASEYRVTPKELEMARQLIDSMSGEWKPEESDAHLPENAATNVVDFMSLLKKSIDTKHRTPARKAAPAKAAKKKVASRAPAKKKVPAKAAPKRRKSA
jgi:DNA end-binding protein Ku